MKDLLTKNSMDKSREITTKETIQVGSKDWFRMDIKGKSSGYLVTKEQMFIIAKLADMEKIVNNLGDIEEVFVINNFKITFKEINEYNIHGSTYFTKPKQIDIWQS